MLHSPSGFPSRISCRIIGCDFSSPDTFTYRLLKAVSCKYHVANLYCAGDFRAHAVPYTGMIISSRETQAVREKVIRLGVSQISGGSRTSVGGYQEEERPTDTEQFDVSDQRTLDEVVHWLMEMGYIPSFCTACYREGRTGDRFMSLCKSGQIQNCCHPNALMTLKEYLVDYASQETKEIGEALIQAELKNIPRERVREICKDHLEKIQEGIRDFRF